MNRTKSKRYLGIQVDEKLRVLIKTRLAEKDMTLHEAVLRGLAKELNIDVSQYLEVQQPQKIAL